jgi:hypothetical protein
VIRLPQAIASVMLGTLAAGAAGGVVGFAIGRLAPSFIRWLSGPVRVDPAFDPAEFALGLGMVSGLVLGSGASLFLAMILVIRDVLVGRAEQADLRRMAKPEPLAEV